MILLRPQNHFFENQGRIEMDGILIVNKPKNCTSHDVVYKVKKITNQR